MAKVLVVDDENDVREFLVTIAREFGYETDQASRLSEALTKLTENPPDLVMLDVNLPDAKGSEGLKKIRTVSPTVKVLMVTGSADDSLEKETNALGALGYVLKPFQIEVLQQLLEKCLSQPS